MLRHSARDGEGRREAAARAGGARFFFPWIARRPHGACGFFRPPPHLSAHHDVVCAFAAGCRRRQRPGKTRQHAQARPPASRPAARIGCPRVCTRPAFCPPLFLAHTHKTQRFLSLSPIHRAASCWAPTRGRRRGRPSPTKTAKRFTSSRPTSTAAAPARRPTRRT